MKFLLVAGSFFYSTISFAQYFYQNASSIVVNTNQQKNNLAAEASFEFNHTQLTGLYNLSDKLFVYSNLKLNMFSQRADRSSFFFGDNHKKMYNSDIGFNAGFGLQNILNVGKYKLQIVAGYEYEKQKNHFDDERYNLHEDLVDSVSYQNADIYKISSNINLVKLSNKYNISYLLRFTYCNFENYKYNNIQYYFRNNDFMMVEPAVQIDFKLLKKRNLLITTQYGLSIPFKPLEYTSDPVISDRLGYDSEGLVDLILKLGMRYNF